MNNNNLCVEGCDIPSTPNDVKIAIRQLKREVINFYEDTTKHLLKHDNELSEICKSIKNNLSNSIRCILDTMLEEGQIEELIRETILANCHVSIRDFRGCW